MAVPETRPEILVVGRNSVLAGAFAACPARPACRFVSHGDLADPSVFDGIRTVVNFALNPDTRRAPYDPAADADLTVGRAAADRGLGFVLMSTRKVYDPAVLAAFGSGGAAEDAPLGPTDHYGANKLRTEEALRALLGERLTVLRIANIVGFDRVPGRAMFMNRMLDTLAGQGFIRFDVSPFVRRDFLPDGDFARTLAAVLARGLTGTWNVGSGRAVEVGRLALWVMEGYGAGELRIADPRHHDEFVLNVGRLQAVIGPLSPVGRLEDLCRAVGRRLRSAE